MSFGQRIRAYFFAGVLITAPLSLTFYLAWLFIDFMDETVTPLIPAKYNPESYLPFSIPGLGLLIVFVSLTLIGALTAGIVGRTIMRIYDALVEKIPGVRQIYQALKQILETVLAQQSDAFREAVLVEYPRRGIWAIGFITGRTEGEVQNLTEEETVNVFLPTTPNPTSGFLLFIPKRDLVPLRMSVEQAIKMVISGGIVTPADPRHPVEQETPQVSAKTFEDVDILREREGRPVLVPKAQSDDPRCHGVDTPSERAPKKLPTAVRAKVRAQDGEKAPEPEEDVRERKLSNDSLKPPVVPKKDGES